MVWTMCTCWPAIAVMAGERGRERELEAAGPGDILITAMKVDDDDLRAVHACAVCAGQDPRCGQRAEPCVCRAGRGHAVVDAGFRFAIRIRRYTWLLA
ncbi:MAG: hypothetical protein ACLQB1_31315 [Streptosporangiaceae bacterium]